MMGEADKTGLSDAMQRIKEAFDEEDFDAAAEAFVDADKITDKETGEDTEPGEKDKAKGKPSLAAILIGGPEKKK